MPAHNANNERVKREYLRLLKEAKQRSEATVDAVAMALARFETFTGHRDFKKFHREQAMAFKDRLADQASQTTGDKLSHATRYATAVALRRFFEWLALQPGYKSKIRYGDAEYFNLSDKDARVATARRPRPTPTVDEVKKLISAMPATTDVEKRDRAVIAFALLTAARDTAIASVKLKHVDLAGRCFHQDAREVQTKFSKTFTTWFFQVGEEVSQVFEDWVRHLRERLAFIDDDPLFPKTRTAIGADQRFERSGLSRAHWANSAPIRTIFREAARRAGLPYFHPHSLRATIGLLAQERCKTAEEFKAWSQNLGHESVLTTFSYYGTVDPRRQAEIIRARDSEPRSGLVSPNAAEFAKEVALALKSEGLEVVKKSEP